MEWFEPPSIVELEGLEPRPHAAFARRMWAISGWASSDELPCGKSFDCMLLWALINRVERIS